MDQEQTPEPHTPESAPADAQSGRSGPQKPADYYDPAQQPDPNRRSGCPKGLLIGCGGAGCLAVILVALLGMWLVRGGMEKLVDLTFSKVDQDLEQMVSIDVTKDQAIAFRGELSRFRTKLNARELSLTQIQPVISALQEAIRDQRLTAAEIDELIRVLEKADTASSPSR